MTYRQAQILADYLKKKVSIILVDKDNEQYELKETEDENNNDDEAGRV